MCRVVLQGLHLFGDGNLSQLIDKAAFPRLSPQAGLEFHVSAKFSCGILCGAYVQAEPSSPS